MRPVAGIFKQKMQAPTAANPGLPTVGHMVNPLI
jgi:hypothetical protein